MNPVADQFAADGDSLQHACAAEDLGRKIRTYEPDGCTCPAAAELGGGTRTPGVGQWVTSSCGAGIPGPNR